MTRNEYLKRYMDYGWTILPVVKGEKRPAVNWKEYQDKKPTPEELREWFKDPSVGIGLITGKASGVIVVDEDSYKKQGKVLDLDTPLIVQSGGGGRHFYFKYQDGIKNSVNSQDAVDVRGEGGFVVLPPTTHPNGNGYQWVNPLPPTLEYLPTLDESFANELIKKREIGEKIKIQDYMNLDEGSRDDSLLRVALSIVNKVDEETAFVLVNSVNNGYNPPLPDRDVERIFRQAVNFVRKNPKEDIKPEDREILEIYDWQKSVTTYEELMKKYGAGVTTGYRLLDGYFKLIPQQLYMISAPTHVGKTTLVLNMAGRAARQGYQVVLASLEQGVFVVPRLQKMFGSEPGLNNISLVAPTKMPKPEDFAKLFEEESSRPKVLIVDHLHYFERGNRGATEEMDKLVVQMQMLANQLEIPIILICHVRKLNADKPPTMDDLKDSSSLSQIPAVVAMMNRDKNSEDEIKSGASIMKNTGTLYIYKNRIFGITGSENFTLHDDGEIIFDKDPSDRLNKKAESLPSLFSGLEDILDD